MSSYVLHDKKHAKTSERVAWTHTVNLFSDPEYAWFEMMETWNDSERLKAAAGVPPGNKSKKPVMHFSLSWHPDQKKKFTKEHMIAAALAALERQGLSEHEALIVAHDEDDQKHPHVHVMVNKVHPQTGLTAKLKYSWTQFSKWALAYEQAALRNDPDNERIYCEQRVENNKARDLAAAARAQDPDQPYTMVKGRRLLRAQWQEQDDLAKALQKIDPELSRSKAMKHAGDALAESRQAHREKWAQIYRDQRTEGQRAGIAEPTGKNKGPVDPDAILAKLTYMRSTFTRVDLAKELHLRTDTREAFNAALESIPKHPDVRSLGKDEKGRERLTTVEMIDVEQQMSNHAHALKSRNQFAVSTGNVRKAVRGSILSEEQAGACAHVTMGRDLTCVVGFAGTGKSTMLGTAREIWETAGYRVQGCALSGIAAHGLEGGSGINSRTIHSLEYAWKDGRDLLDSRSVLVIDEAGMIGSRQLGRVLKAAHDAGAKVVLCGDANQLQSIEAGASFRAIVDQTGSTKITTVRRQRTPWMQEATVELATNQTSKAIERYETRGMIHAHRTAADAKTAMLESWSQAQIAQPEKSQIMFAHRNADVNNLNDQARDHMRQAGKLGTDHSIQTEEGHLDVAVGERIRFTRNNRPMAVMNGTLGTLTNIKGKQLTIRLDDGNRIINVDLAQYNYLDHGYAVTVHKAQGMTVDQSHFLLTPGLDAQAAYTGLSRHRDTVQAFWSQNDFKNRDNMIAKLSRDNTKDTTLDYEAPTRPDSADTLTTDLDRALYINEHRERLAAGGDPLTNAQADALVKSPDALAEQVTAMHAFERKQLADIAFNHALELAKQKLKGRSTDHQPGPESTRQAPSPANDDAEQRAQILRDHLEEQRKRDRDRGRGGPS